MVGIFVIFASVAGLTASLLLWLSGLAALSALGFGYGGATLMLALLVLRAARQPVHPQEFQGLVAEPRLNDHLLVRD